MSKDRLILENLVAAFSYNKYFSDAKVDVDVKDGKVTLTGTVCDWKQKELIEVMARNNTGVVTVENRIQIDEPAVSSLMEIGVINSENFPLAADIKGTLNSHPALNAVAMDVVGTKRPGVFYLRGYAASADDRAEAEGTANAVRGIRYVINELVVDAQQVEESTNRLVESAEARPVDRSLMEKYAVSSQNAALLSEIKEQLLKHPSLNASGIEITAEAYEVGIFHLSGKVPTAGDKEAAELTARNVRGVKYIDNRLEVVA